MNRVMGELIHRFGQTVTIWQADGTTMEVKAFVQPVLRRGQETPQHTPTPLGDACFRKYRCLTDRAMAAGDRMQQGSRSFWVSAAEPVFWRDKFLYGWALLETVDEEDTCQ